MVRVRPPEPDSTPLRVNALVLVTTPSAVPKFSAALTVPLTSFVGEYRNAPLVRLIGPPERAEAPAVAGASSTALAVTPTAGTSVAAVMRTLSVWLTPKVVAYSLVASGRKPLVSYVTNELPACPPAVKVVVVPVLPRAEGRMERVVLGVVEVLTPPPPTSVGAVVA